MDQRTGPVPNPCSSDLALHPRDLATVRRVTIVHGSRGTIARDAQLRAHRRAADARAHGRRLGRPEVAPRIRDLDRAHQFDRSLFPQMAALGLLGIPIPAAYGGAGWTTSASAWPAKRSNTSTPRFASSCRCTSGLQRSDAADLGNRRSEAALSGTAGTGQHDRHLRADRAVGRQRCPRHPDGRRAQG